MGNYILPILLAAVGTYFLIKLRFFFIIHPHKTVARGFRAIKDKRALRSFFLALAGTLGVGNVLGVAIGIIIGGAGSLFWLLVSMVFAMVIKYSEVVISSDNLFHDTDTHGGFFYVFKQSFRRIGGLLSGVYALAVLALSCVLGAALQTDAVSESLSEIGSVSSFGLALILTVLVLFSIVGGTHKIEKVTSIIIPLTTIIYIIMTLSIIAVNFSSIGAAIKHIVSSAFTFESTLGGGVGFLLSAPIKEGFSRGILSNEAGAGTSSMAHARSGVLSPATAGILGILEVWFDTGLICTLTGLSILLSVPDPTAFESGMELIMFTVGNLFGIGGKYAMLFCVFSFAYATVICWYYYGLESWSALFGKKKRALFLPLFLIFVFLGCFSDSYTLVLATDLLMAIATILTLSALIKNSDRIKHLSESGGVIDSDKGRIRPFRIKGNVFSKGERHR